MTGSLDDPVIFCIVQKQLILLPQQTLCGTL